MSPSGRTEHVRVLRAAIARIEKGGLAPTMPLSKPASTAELGPGPGSPGPGRRIRPVLPLGERGFSLDRLLGGGLKAGALHEIVPATPRDEGAASGFAAALAACCLQAGGTLIWIVQDFVALENGGPYGPGLETQGLDPGRLIVVRTREARATLWAAEESLRAGSFTVLAELWGGRYYGLAPSRRLVLAAQARGGTGLLLHAGLPGGSVLSSGSETRFAVAAQPSPQLSSAGGRMPIPGPATFGVRLAKVRGGTAQNFDRDHVHSVSWNPEQRCLHDRDLSFGLASPSADQPAQALRTGTRSRRSGT